MSLSPSAIPFFSCTPSDQLCRRNEFLSRAKVSLSRFECNLFTEVLCDWERSLFLSSCFTKWQKCIPVPNSSCSSSVLHVLSFNVRGLDKRWQETILLDTSFNFDVLILLETGRLELSFYEKCFNQFRLFYQKGENRNGGVLLLVRNTLHVSRLQCNIPNVCVVDIKGNENLRIIGVYAPASKSWSWDDLSSYVSNKCVIFGDFNVDISEEGSKAASLLKWTDDQFLAPFIPDSPTSLRSNRIIDFALSSGTALKIQTYHGNTSSDHVPILSVIPFDIKYTTVGKKVHWNVFSLFTEYTFS